MWVHPNDMPLSDAQIEEAYQLWRQKPYGDRGPRPVKGRNRHSKLMRARTASLLSGNEMARRLKLSRMGYWKMERRDAEGRISINDLKRAADALGCEVIVKIVPKLKRTYSRLIFDLLLKSTKRCPMVRNARPLVKWRVLVTANQWDINEPCIRRLHRWTQRKNIDPWPQLPFIWRPRISSIQEVLDDRELDLVLAATECQS